MKKILSIAAFIIASLHLIYLVDAWSKYNQLADIFSNRIFLLNSINEEVKKGYFFGFLVDSVIILASIFGFISSINDEKKAEYARRQEAQRDFEIYKNATRVNTQVINSTIKVEDNYKGTRDIANDSYKLYLVNKYKVKKNDVFNKFVYNEKMYESIDEVLLLLDEYYTKNPNKNVKEKEIIDPFYIIKQKLNDLGYSITESSAFNGNTKYELKKGSSVQYFYTTEEFLNYAKSLL